MNNIPATYIGVLSILIFLPTIFYYLGWAVLLWVLRNTAPAKHATIVICYVAVPLVAWGMSYSRYATAKRDYERKVKAVSINLMPVDMPSTLVVQEGHIRLPPGPGCFRTILGSSGDPVAGADVRPMFLDKDRRDPGRATLPDRYLLLRMGRTTRNFQELTSFRDQGPYELSLVEAGSQTLVALEAPFRGLRPTFPPMLAMNGWLTDDKPDTTEPPHTQAADFVRDVTGLCKPRQGGAAANPP